MHGCLQFKPTDHTLYFILILIILPSPLVSLAAVFSIVTQRLWGGALRDDTKNISARK